MKTSKMKCSLVLLSIALVACGGSEQNSTNQNNQNNQTSSGNHNSQLTANTEDASTTSDPTPSQGPDVTTVAAVGPDATAPQVAAAPDVTSIPTPTPSVPALPARPAMNAAAREQFRSGSLAAEQGNLGGARTAFEAALSSDPRAFQAAYNAGIIAERQGQDPQADSFYQRALSIQPDYELAVIARARLLIRTRRLNEAVTMAADVSRRYQGNFAVRAEYARLLVLANNNNEAIEEGRRILRLDERNVGAKLAIAEAFRAQGLRDQSLYIVDDVINGPDPENHPESGPGAGDPRAHYLRGLLRIEINRDVPGAITSFTRAVSIDAHFAEAQNNLGVYLAQAGNYTEAVAHLRSAVSLAPTWAKAHLNLGDVLRASRSYDDALAEFSRAQQLDAAMVEVHYNYGRLFGEQAREIPSQGLENLNRKLQLLQQSQAAFTRFKDTLGAQYANHERHDDVEGQLTRLTQLIERTTRSRDRAQNQARRNQAAGADGGATPASTGGDAGSH